MQKICNNAICFILNPVNINPSQILILALLVAISAFTSGSEIALVSLSKSKVDSLVSKRVRNAKLLQKVKEVNESQENKGMAEDEIYWVFEELEKSKKKMSKTEIKEIDSKIKNILGEEYKNFREMLEEND